MGKNVAPAALREELLGFGRHVVLAQTGHRPPGIGESVGRIQLEPGTVIGKGTAPKRSDELPGVGQPSQQLLADIAIPERPIRVERRDSRRPLDHVEQPPKIQGTETGLEHRPLSAGIHEQDPAAPGAPRGSNAIGVGSRSQ